MGVCGHSGSGKTTLIEQLLPLLRARGLTVAVVKHDAHTLQIDQPGKDSDRLFRAGADVLAHDPEQAFIRLHGALSLSDAIRALSRRYDLVLVEGHKRSSVPKLWLLGEGEDRPPPEVTDMLRVLPRDEARAASADEEVRRFLERFRTGP